MSYRIQYLPPVKKHHTGIRRGLLTILCFFLFWTMVVSSWPEAVQLIQDKLKSFRPAIMVAAMDEMAISLQEGTGIRQALGAFVQHVLQESGLGAG